MNKLIPLVAVGVCVGSCSATACIQTMRFVPPHSESQLPAELFKIHVHIDPEPITLTIPLLAGQTTISPGSSLPRDPQSEFEQLIRNYEADPTRHATFAERNDYAAALLFAGRFADSIPVLLKLENDEPGKYSTASNLGTAYELVGDLANATAWIQKGIERSSVAHDGTEWLHLAILEAKQKLRTDANWLTSHSVLDGQKNRSKSELERALEYQLNERLYFIKNDDLVMCDLMYQAALITSDPAKRAYFLKQAPRFGDIRKYQIRKLVHG